MKVGKQLHYNLTEICRAWIDFSSHLQNSLFALLKGDTVFTHSLQQNISIIHRNESPNCFTCSLMIGTSETSNDIIHWWEQLIWSKVRWFMYQHILQAFLMLKELSTCHLSQVTTTAQLQSPIMPLPFASDHVSVIHHFHFTAAWSSTYCESRCTSSSDNRGPNVHLPCKYNTGDKAADTFKGRNTHCLTADSLSCKLHEPSSYHRHYWSILNPHMEAGHAQGKAVYPRRAFLAIAWHLALPIVD